MKITTCFFLLVLLILFVIGCQDKPEPTTNKGTQASVSANTQMDKSEKIKHGAYLVKLMVCNDCHTPWKMTPDGPAPDMDRYLSGHPSYAVLPPVDPNVTKDYVLFSMTNTAIIGPWGTSFTANLTPDETGIGNWTEEQFAYAIRHGKFKGMENGRSLLPPMPWQEYKSLTDEDLSAVFAYLKSIKPIQNVVPPPILPANISMK